jgi:hypothetical protein
MHGLCAASVNKQRTCSLGLVRWPCDWGGPVAKLDGEAPKSGTAPPCESRPYVVAEGQSESGKPRLAEEGPLTLHGYVYSQATVPKVWECGGSAVSASEPVGMVAAGRPPLSVSLRGL